MIPERPLIPQLNQKQFGFQVVVLKLLMKLSTGEIGMTLICVATKFRFWQVDSLTSCQNIFKN